MDNMFDIVADAGTGLATLASDTGSMFGTASNILLGDGEGHEGFGDDATFFVKKRLPWMAVSAALGSYFVSKQADKVMRTVNNKTVKEVADARDMKFRPFLIV